MRLRLAAAFRRVGLSSTETVDGGVDEDTRVPQRPPQQQRLPVVAHLDGHDRRDDLRAVRQAVGLHDPEAALLEPVAQVRGVREQLGQQRRAVAGAQHAQGGERRAGRRGDAARREEEGARLDAQEVDDLGRAGHEAAAGGQGLGEGAGPQVDAVLDAHELAGPGAARAQDDSDAQLTPDDIFARVGPIKNTANTHIVSHAGHLLALMEGLGPIEVADDLTTIGPFDFDGRLAGSMTAHPKTDPVTGEMVFFGYSPVAPYLRVHSSDRSGELTWSTVVELPGPVMMHDFVVTESRVVIFDLPAVFDLHALLRGETAIFWDPARGARVGVLDRGAPGSSVRWIDVDPFWVFHFFNAHDEPDGSIAVTGCRAERLNTTFDGSELTDGYRPSVWRWTIGAEATSFGATQLDDAPTDFPRIDERRTGLDNRIGYSGHAARWSGDEVVFDGVTRYDLRTGSSEYRRFGANVTCGETVFAPDPDDPAEGSGWLLSFVHDHDADESMVAVLDAPTLEPVATVHLPRRVPFGFHGSYVAASAS